MDDRQSNKYNMGATVQNLLDDNTTLTTGKPLVVAAKTQLDTNLDTIDTHRQAQTIETTGTTLSKSEAKSAMANQGAILSAGISAIAAAAGDTITATEYDLEISDLSPASDTAARTINEKVKNKMTAMSAQLVTNGYSLADQTAYTAAINAFRNLIGKPDQIRAQKSGYTEALITDFEHLDTGLIQLDKSMKIFLLTQTVFYEQYLAARKIDDTGVRHISIRGLVKDKNTGALLPKTKLTLSPGTTIVKSGTTGKFSIFSLSAGSYSILVELSGYASKTVTGIVVNPTGITDILIELEP